jgi:flagellar basal body rod protein FlgC
MSIAGLSSILATAQTGMNRGVARLNHAAGEIARGKVDVQPMVDMIVAEHEVATNARVVRTADEMHKSLLDILA